MGEWTRSGDKYMQDEDGYYVYCGRNDDMLKVSGLYVSPFEVEGALQTHDDVLECAVVAWLDGDGLIKPKAFIVLKDHGGVAGSRQGDAGAVQISPLDRIPRRSAQDRDRQDPALHAARGITRRLTAIAASCRAFDRSGVLNRSDMSRYPGASGNWNSSIG
jgi:acyl-CoA synthetase (AMP-forming)/AMP-acid ligase II